MELASVLTAFENLDTVLKVVILVLPILTAAAGMLRLRLDLVRRYLRLTSRISTLAKYAATRDAAFKVLPFPVQNQIEELEFQAARRIGIILDPAAHGPRAYRYTFDRAALAKTVRLLTDSIIVDFVEDMHERLILIMDSHVDIVNLRSVSAALLDPSAYGERVAALRSKLAEDVAQYGRQLALVESYINGLTELDIHAPRRADNVRAGLNEKYRIYCELTSDDTAGEAVQPAETVVPAAEDAVGPLMTPII